MIGRVFILTLALVAGARAGGAQTVTLTPTDSKRWDTSVTVGWLSGDKEEITGAWDHWYDTFATSLEVGRYWAPHLKTELTATFTTSGAIYSQEEFIAPGQPAPVFFSREHSFGLTALDVGAAYQALENSWVHPFVAGGVQLAWERHSVETPFGSAFSRDGRGPFLVPDLAPLPRRVFDAKPYVSGGAKLYVTENGFLRTDLSAAFDSHGAARVWWRVGGGVDF